MDDQNQQQAYGPLHVRPAPPPPRRSRFWGVVKWLLVIGLVGVCLFVVLAGLFSSVVSSFYGGPKIIEEHVAGASVMGASAKVAVLSAHDVIMGDETGGTASWIIDQIERAERDEAVKAVILDVNSPGGGITACDIIHNKIRDLRTSGKNVYVIMRNIAASGGYYISAPANEIYAHPTTLTGSIGVIVSALKLDELMKKVGVDIVIFKTGPHKDILSPYREVSDEEREIVRQITSEMFDRFKTVVQEGRQLTDEELEQVTDGRIFTASQALEYKLIDKIGYFEDARRAAVGSTGLPLAEVAVVRYKQPPTFSDLLFAGAAASAAERMEKRLEGITRTLEPGVYYLWPGL